MKMTGIKIILVLGMFAVYLLFFSMMAIASDDWQEIDIPGYSDDATQVLGFTVTNNEDVYVIYSVNDPTGEILPFPMAKMYDGSTWIELGSGFITEENGGQCVVRYDEASERLFVGLVTINGVVHIYEYKGDEWEELTYPGRLLRIDPQYVYYDLQLLKDGSLVVAYVDIEEDGRITAKAYEDGKWNTLGRPGFTDYTANYISLAVDGNSQSIYAAVIVDRRKIEVWKYSKGEGWSVTDSSNIEPEYPYWVKLEIGNGDRPILIYMDTEFEWKTIGMIYDDGVWNYLEPYPFSPAIIRSFAMKMDSNGWPVVYFNDSEYENKVTSMKYNGEAWEYIGRRGFVQSGTGILFAGLDMEDVPFLILPKDGINGQIVKMEYGESDASVSGDEEKADDVEAVEETESTATNAQSEKTETKQQDQLNDDNKEDSSSQSRFTVIVSFLVVVFIIIVILFLLKKKRDDDEK